MHTLFFLYFFFLMMMKNEYEHSIALVRGVDVTSSGIQFSFISCHILSKSLPECETTAEYWIPMGRVAIMMMVWHFHQFHLANFFRQKFYKLLTFTRMKSESIFPILAALLTDDGKLASKSWLRPTLSGAHNNTKSFHFFYRHPRDSTRAWPTRWELTEKVLNVKSSF